MLKRDFFIAAMKSGCYKKIAWMVKAFSVTRQGPSPRDNYDYSLIVGSDFVQYLLDKQTHAIEDTVDGQALFRFKERLTIGPGDIPNLDRQIETTYGNLLFNWIVLIEPFGKKIPYKEGRVAVPDIEKIILSNFRDNDDVQEGAFYVKEYLLFAQSVHFLTGITQLCTWATTEKTMISPEGILKFKEGLLVKYKDSLGDMATIANIDKELVAFDAAWLKGDPGENFLIGKKSRGIVRKKKFLMIGAEMGLDGNTVNANIITNSLDEGWNVNKMPEMINSLRAGSFNRGAQTELGGVSVKWLLRASSNMNITIDDCGSRLGSITTVTQANKGSLVGFNIITATASKTIESIEEAGEYIGKRVMMRNPMYCKLDNTDYCKVCVGKRLVVNPEGLSMAVTEYGSSFLGIFMSAAHAKALTLAKMDFKTAIF